MMRYSLQPRDKIFLKSYGFSSFAKNIGKNIGKIIRKNLSGKLITLNNLQQMRLKLLQKE